MAEPYWRLFGDDIGRVLNGAPAWRIPGRDTETVWGGGLESLPGGCSL